MIRTVWISMLAIGISAPVQAQSAQQQPAQEQPAKEPKDDDFHSDRDIVVTAPYVERLDLLAGTSAISGEELAEKSRGQLGDSLTSLPGVSATSFSPGASRPVLRGYQGSRVNVLTDGIGNIDASNTSADHAVTIDSLTAERIEVLRGAAVLLFGGQAVGGAVNVIDKRIPRKIPAEHVHIDALLGYSSASNDFSGGLSADFKLDDRLVAHIDGSYRNSGDVRSGGFVLSPELRADALNAAAEQRRAGNAGAAEAAESLAALRGDVPNSAVETWTFSTGLAYIDGDNNLGVSFNIYDTNYGVPARPSIEADGGEAGDGEAPVSIDLRQYRFDLRGNLDLGDGFFERITLRAGYADYEHTEFEGSDVGTRFLSKGFEGRSELVQSDKNGWKGASGVQYQYRDFEAIGAEAFVPPNITNQAGIFTLQEIKLGHFEVELAGRLDYASLEASTLNENVDFTNFSGAFGLAYAKAGIKFGINISRTGRAPSAEELFSNGPHIATQAFEIGNPDLRSERSWNGEIYTRYEDDNLALRATVYTNRFDNFIFEIETGEEEDGLPVFQYGQDDANVWGFELEASAELGFAAGFDVSVDGVADFTRAQIADNGGNLPRIPPLRLLGGLELTSGSIDLRGEVEYSADQNDVTAFETPTDGFTFINASVTWRPFGRDRNIALIGTVNNIFDVEGRRAASFTKDFVPLAGRDFRLNARFSF